MLWKKVEHNHCVSNKLTFRTYQSLNFIIIQLEQLLPLLWKLLDNSVLRISNLEQVIENLQNFPKTFQRNINLLNESSVIDLLEEIIKNLLSSKKQRKFKPYHLFTSWKSVQQILVKRISKGIKGNIEQISNSPRGNVLYNFIRDIKSIGSLIQQWAKLKTIKKQKQSQQKLKFLHSETFSILKTISPTARQTAVSSACISRNNSKHQQLLNQESKEINQNHKSMILRSSTAKPEREQMKLTKRSPSANRLLTNEYFRKPTFQTKKSLKKIITKNNDRGSKNKIISSKTSKNSHFNNFSILNGIQQNQEEKNALKTTNIRKVSILNKSFDNDQLKSSCFLKEQISKTPPGLESNSVSSLKIVGDAAKLNEFNENNQQSNKKQAILQSLNQQIRSKEMVRTQQRKKTGNYSKRRQNNSLITEQKKRISVQSFQQLSKHEIKFNKPKASYKVPRKSGKTSIRSIDSIKNLEKEVKVKKQMSNFTYFTKRRKAMISEKKMSQIQKIVNQSKKQAEDRKIQFQENVLLALAETIKLQKNNIHKQSLQKHQSDQTFEYKYSQLNRFIKNSQFSLQNTHISTFFDQQEHIKRAQDLIVKERIKSLRKKQPITSIFELACVTKNNKDIIYNQFQRRFSFFSDAQWIKQAFQFDNNLQQKNL